MSIIINLSQCEGSLAADLRKRGVCVDIKDKEFSQRFSRPSHPRPELIKPDGEERKKYKVTTQKIVDIANQSFQLLQGILHAGFIDIHEE
ncbi:hypothetical protein, partial [Salmonella sp. s51228]|uniref:hypothetical protein n=1 Tax=Salmonella sp. s51228 TaxID=3159652 RepID=UPI00398175EE